MGSLKPDTTYIYERNGPVIYAREFGATERRVVGYDVDLENKIFGMRYQPKPSRPIALKTIKQRNPEKVGIQNNINCKCAFT